MIDRETAAMVKGEEWCDGFIVAHNAQACAADGLRIVIGELEDEIAELNKALDAAKAKLAEMSEAFDALADMMWSER